MSLSKAGLVSPIPVTLAQRDAIIDKQPGYIVYNTDEQEAEMWTGTEWIILGSRPGVLNYRGGIDMTTSAPTYQPPENGDMYLNEKEGVAVAGWANLTGLGVLPNDRVVFDGTDWALITSGGGIPNLQVVTDAGDTTTHTITTAGYITAGNVQATDGYFSGDVGIGTTSPDYTLHVENSSGGQALVKSSGNTTSRLFFANTGSSANNRVSVGATNEDFRVDAGGTERFRVKSNGNVGIGTSSPTSVLQVSSGDNTFYDATASDGQADKGATLNIDLRANTNGGIAQILFTQRSTNELARIVATGGTSPALAFTTNTSEKMRIDSAGRVGIGTSSPDSRLHVVDSNDNGLRIGYTGNTNYYDAPIHIWRNPSGFAERMRIDSNGNVGIGTVSPAATLQIGTDTPVIRLNGANDGANVYGDIARNGGDFEFKSRGGNTNNGSFSFINYDGSSESLALKIASSGRVGIGTDSPSSKLTVQDSKKQQIEVRSDGDANSDSSIILKARNGNNTLASSAEIICTAAGRTNNNSDLRFAVRKSGDDLNAPNTVMTLQGAGNVGIGDTNPSQKVVIADDGSQLRLTRTGDNTSNYLDFYINNTYAFLTARNKTSRAGFIFRGYDSSTNVDYMRIMPSGDVGIGLGDDLPTVKLDIGGTVKIRSANQLQFNNSDNTSGASIQAENTTATPALTFNTFGSEKMRLNSAGALLIGASDSLSTGSSTAGLQVHNNVSQNGAMVSIARFAPDSTGGKLVLGKSRSGTVVAGTAVQDNDAIGVLEFAADDGTDLDSRVAEIHAKVDGTVGVNSTPGRIEFRTTADGSNTPTERMRITSNGSITTFGNRLQVRSTVENSTDKFLSGAVATSITSSSTERFAIFTDGSARFDGDITAGNVTRFRNNLKAAIQIATTLAEVKEAISTALDAL